MLSTCQAVAITGVEYITTGCVVTFSAELTGDPPFTYDWNFGAFGHSPLPSPTVDFGASGTYPFTLTVWNCSGEDSDTAAGAVEVHCDDCIPVTQTSFTWTPLTPTVSQPVRFSGQAEGSPLITMTWALGEDGSGSGAVITHTFTMAGSYTVTLTATNACGVDWATQQVVVEGSMPYPIYLPVIFRLAIPL